MPRGFEVLETLAEGGMGQVLRARHVSTDRIVALKILKGRPDERSLARFRFEARTLAKLRHRASVRVVGHGDDETGQPYLAMELVPGGSLAEAIARDGPFPATRAIGIVTEVLGALEEAHGLGLIHRDVKPSNILLRKGFEAGQGVGERPILCDFGLAKLVGDEDAPPEDDRSARSAKTLERAPVATGDLARFTQTAALVGTPAYMSPEQALGEPLDAQTDVYSVGVVLYELLAGRPPFAAPHLAGLLAQILEATPDPLPGAVDPELALLVQAAMARDRAARVRSAAALRTRLTAIGRRLVSQSPSVQLEASRPAERRIGRGVLAGLGGLLLLGIGLQIPSSCDGAVERGHNRELRRQQAVRAAESANAHERARAGARAAATRARARRGSEGAAADPGRAPADEFAAEEDLEAEDELSEPAEPGELVEEAGGEADREEE